MHFSDEFIDDTDDGYRPFEGVLVGVLVGAALWVCALALVWEF